MNLGKKILISSLIIILTMSVYGCSNNNKENNESTSITNSSNKESNSSNIKIDEDINKYYDTLLEKLKNGMDSERLAKIEKNIPTFKELNQKAKNACAKGFYLEQTISNLKEQDVKHQIKLKVSADGSSRQEEYKNDKLLYLNIYSKADDTDVYYEVEKDKLNKTTQFSKKNQGNYPYKLGFCNFMNDNLRGGEIKYIDYNGKKVVYIEVTSQGKDKKDQAFKVISKFWVDAETGIRIKDEQQSYLNDKLESTYTNTYTIKFDQSFDKDIFTFDKTKLNK